MDDTARDIHAPRAGIDTSAAFSRQPARQIAPGVWARSCADALNFRGFEALTRRGRGGSRAGLAKYLPTQISGTTWIAQELTTLATLEGTPVQLSQSGRVVYLVAVSAGNVYTAVPGATGWTAANNVSGETPALNASGLVYSAPNNQKMYFVDGTNYVYWDPTDNKVHLWTASAGSMPVDASNNTARLICTWRGRTVLAGLLLDSANWFMSKVSDPTNFDYGPVSISPTQAVAGNNSPLGLIGDTITGLCPYSDDILIMFGDSSIYMLRGDPMAGGQIDLITDAIGAAWGKAWCRDPQGTVYFFSNRTGVFSLVPGQGQPQRISQSIEQQLQAIDTGKNGVRLLWDDRFQGVHLFVTPLDAPAATTHYFWESRTGAWWPDRFADPNMDPLCCCTYDGNLPTDRVPLIGSWDGYVRAVSPTALDDDGVPISSSVTIGPINSSLLDEMMLSELQAVLGETSGAITYEIRTGATAEAALATEPVETGTLSPSRNLTSRVRTAGHALYLTLKSDSPWALETLRLRVGSRGKIRARGR